MMVDIMTKTRARFFSTGRKHSAWWVRRGLAEGAMQATESFEAWLPFSPSEGTVHATEDFEAWHLFAPNEGVVLATEDFEAWI